MATADPYNNTTMWMSTTASQIFFMQLGFLCYEVGFVKAVWTQSVILKNIEDTFVDILTFLAFGYTLSESSESFHGIIAIPTNPLLIGIDRSLHDQILISAFFASTCATIISGAVLERMKNKAYISWCFLIILVNYSFVSHWVWHKHGWLNQLGFVDGAGSVVVHSTAGMGALIAVWKLGPRRDSVDVNGRLLPTEHAAKPIINAIGAFFLWYGWFAFNVASPIAMTRNIGDALGTTALVTVVSPISSSCAAFVWMHLGYVKLSFESLLNCLLSGLVAITGMCHTCFPLEAVVIGMGASIVYFLASRLVRQKWQLDDPLQVITIHLFCGIYSGIAEGIIANDVYGTPGIMRSGSFKHFGVQLLGVVCIITFNFLVSLFLWEIILKRGIWRKIDIRVSILDIYLGTKLFDQNYDMALDEVITCNSNVSKQMLWDFHKYIDDRYASEQLDFLIVTKIYNHYLKKNEDIDKTDKYQAAKYILRIVATYVDENGANCINVSGKQRAILMRIKEQLLFEIKTDRMEREKAEKKREKEQNVTSGASDETKETDPEQKESEPLNATPNKETLLRRFSGGIFHSGLDITRENVFDRVFESVWKLVIPHFTTFLQNCYDIEKKAKFDIKIPFKLDKNWQIVWDQVLEKDLESMHLEDTVPQYNNSETLLSKMLQEYDEQRRPSRRRASGLHEIELVQDYNPPIVIAGDGARDDGANEDGDNDYNETIVIENADGTKAENEDNKKPAKFAVIIQ